MIFIACARPHAVNATGSRLEQTIRRRTMSKIAPGIKMDAYEKERAAHHERTCRAAATVILSPYVTCRIRKCRRDGKCTGPTLPSGRQMGQIRAQKALGLSGNACARLPICIALAENGLFAAFEVEVKKMSERNKGQPYHGLHFGRAVAARLWPGFVSDDTLDFPA
jgi:hypothetical protein